jgi:hypothetical protein
MALVRRGNCQFFIRSVRRGGRVTSRYVGSGNTALDFARQAADARQRAETRRRERQRELALWSDFDAAFRLLCDLNRSHARAALYAAGYYLHRRQWRKKGKRPMTTPAKITEDDIPQSLRDRVSEFLRQSAESGTTPKECVAFFESVREELTPATYRWLIARLAQRLNDCDSVAPIVPGAQARQALVKWLSEGWGLPNGEKTAHPADLEIQRRYLDVLRDDLAGPDAPPLEHVLADQVVLSSAEVNGLTGRVLQSEKQWLFDEANHFDRRRDRATRRMHESIKLLHLIRSKTGPALQVNVQQNVLVPPETPAHPKPRAQGSVQAGRR